MIDRLTSSLSQFKFKIQGAVSSDGILSTHPKFQYRSGGLVVRVRDSRNLVDKLPSRVKRCKVSITDCIAGCSY